MLSIPCPYCGPRDETEFRCAGESHIARPSLECDDDSWASYLFLRDNPRGLTAERWRHTFGCGRWFNAIRDTARHTIRSTYAMTDPRPDPDTLEDPADDTGSAR